MADKKELSEEEQKQVEKIAEIVKMFRQIINEDGAVENNFYLQYLPAKSIDGMRSWMWIPFEQILEPEEAERFITTNKDHPFFLMLSHYAVHAPLQGKPELVKRYEQTPKEKRQGKPDYAAMVESVDQSVGRILRTLKRHGLEDETLVIFTSDNGGFAKATDNSPLRANKGSNYEGGIRVPLLIRWPGVSQAGSVSDEPVISTDFYPTILDAAGQDPRPHQHVDGMNLRPLMSGTGRLNRDAVYWHFPHYLKHPHSFPSGVIRAREWKLIEDFETGELSLFNLKNDLSETQNLAERLPETAEKLHQMLITWRESVGADPMKPNPEYEGQ